MLTLAQLKAHLKLDAADPAEDALLGDYLATALAAFFAESKRRRAVVGEPAVVRVTDPTAAPPVTEFVRYVDPAVLSPAEELIAGQWLRLTLGHWYENRQSVAVGLNVAEVPLTAQKLMNLLREPTL